MDVAGREFATGEVTANVASSKLNRHIASQVGEQCGLTHSKPVPQENIFEFGLVSTESSVHGFPIFAPPPHTPSLRQVNPAAHAAPVTAPTSFSTEHVRVSSRSETVPVTFKHPSHVAKDQSHFSGLVFLPSPQ